jgi:colanic acid biosynthesis glycosyl transferase WcaI
MKDATFNILIDKCEDIQSVVNLHMDYLPSNYNKNKYFKRLLRYYYETLRDDRNSKLISAEINGKIIGYACLVNSLRKLYLKMLGANIVDVSLNLLKLLYYQKNNFTMKYLNIHKNNNVKNNKELQRISLKNKYELRPIIVSKDYQGTKVAYSLLLHAEEFLINKGEKYYFLRVYKDNARAIKYYYKNGFNVIEEDDEQTSVMGKTLKPRINVLITTQVFPPEIHPSAVMVKELAEDISKKGWQVSVVTGYPHHPYGRLYPGYIKKLLSIDTQNGFRVIRSWHLINSNSGMLSRTLVMLSQAGAYFFAAKASPRPDVIISYGPPLIGPLISSLIARRNHARLLTLIFDIYPDIALESGYLRNPALIRAARKLENLIYRRSDKIGVLSEGFRRTLIVEKSVDPQKVALIPVWLDVRDIFPMSRDNAWRGEMGIALDKFVVLYAGTIGLVSGAEVVVEAAKRLENYQDVLFLLVGAGYAKDQVEAKVNDSGLKNVLFLPFQPRKRLSEVQATADVSLVTLAPGRGKTSVPSKVLGYMAAARPVIASVDRDCDTAQLIREAECGAVAPPGEAAALAETILHFYQCPEHCRTMGVKGLEYFIKKFERRQVLDKYIALLAELSLNQSVKE